MVKLFGRMVQNVREDWEEYFSGRDGMVRVFPYIMLAGALIPAVIATVCYFCGVDMGHK